jgi:pseudouridine kinase
MDNDFLIIGGSNVDYTAISNHKLLEHDSNIGTLKISFGGVGRNITEDLILLGDKVSFITSIGNGANGIAMKKSLEGMGVDVFNIESTYPSSSYLAMLEPDGEMKVALCDCQIMETMKPKSLEQYADIIKSHQSIIIEANLSQAVIDFLFEKYADHHILVEAVSANKVVKFKKHLSEIYLFKSNIIEAKSILDMDAPKEELVAELMKRGVKKVVITDGPHSIYIGDENKVTRIKVPLAKKVISESGAGDAMFAGILHGCHKKLSLEDSVRFGIKVSQKTLEIPETCNPDISSLI